MESKSSYPDMNDMVRLRDLRADSGKGLSGAQNPVFGNIICGWLVFSFSPALVVGTSFFFFTNSKNSATWRAYLHKSKFAKSIT